MKKGWLHGKEVNTVVFDPAQISTGKIENILKRAGTYKGTVLQQKAEKRMQEMTAD